MKREGKGEAVFGKDSALPVKTFAAGDDNCNNVLHPVRFERAPVADRAKFWHLLPVKRVPTYRRLSLEHGGAAAKISESVIVRAHDRTLPLKIKMFHSANRMMKGFGSSESKEEAKDWDCPKVI